MSNSIRKRPKPHPSEFSERDLETLAMIDRIEANQSKPTWAQLFAISAIVFGIKFAVDALGRTDEFVASVGAALMVVSFLCLFYRSISSTYRKTLLITGLFAAPAGFYIGFGGALTNPVYDLSVSLLAGELFPLAIAEVIGGVWVIAYCGVLLLAWFHLANRFRDIQF